jgi:hypothetical protein
MNNLQRRPKDLPFLEAICWQTTPVQLQTLEPLELLRCYERGWQYLDVVAEPSSEEWTFIQQLVKHYGSWLVSEPELIKHVAL